MWTQRGWSQACLSSRGAGEILVKQVEVSKYVPEDNVKCWGRPAIRGVHVLAKVAVESESGMARQAPLLLKESGEATSTASVAKRTRSRVECLEFAGRLENADSLSPTKVAKGRVVVIAGPTAVGKSRVAMALAKQLGGEIISADSIQPWILQRGRAV
ncbi:hypothetical protein KC19_5G068500 [Ceratodon purpureus]|uniref:Uncharacterized protein n=1 Tax=Ceratodon purpureus TaxID=3225 RepID=A0A8T0HYN2_CERPU|nr:hypothetical protein KC19_5G068500 [Ceratodon purpureus]